MKRDTEVSFMFYAAEPGDNLACKRVASGFESVHHAEMWGHHYAAALSAVHGKQMFLAHLTYGDGNFACLCVPTYYEHGVNVHVIADGERQR